MQVSFKKSLNGFSKKYPKAAKQLTSRRESQAGCAISQPFPTTWAKRLTIPLGGSGYVAGTTRFNQRCQHQPVCEPNAAVEG